MNWFSLHLAVFLVFENQEWRTKNWRVFDGSLNDRRCVRMNMLLSRPLTKF